MTGRGDCRKVMVVEDDYEIRATLTEVLRDEGYSVEEAANGQEALSCLRKAADLPCIILLDLMMPVMDGWQFRDAQLQDPKLTGIPVIVVSADGNARQKAASMKAALGLTKPVQLDELLSTVEHYCLTEPASR